MTDIYESSMTTYAAVLEGDDAEKLRDILVADIEFYSESSKKTIKSIDEYIEWTRYVQGNAKTVITAKVSITSTPTTDFPVGSRALVLSYGDKRSFSDIVFFEFSPEGKIKRIYISKGTGYKYTLDRLPGVPTDDEIEARIAELMASAEDDDSEVVEYIEEQEDNYSGDIADFAFREAIRQGIVSYIENHAEEFDLNDGGGYSSYLYESDDPEIQDVLMECGAFRSWEDYSDCRFATETVNGSILAYDEDFQKEVFQKYLETYSLTEDDVIAMFDDEDAAESFEDEHDRCFSDDMEAMGIVVEDDAISFEDKVDSDGWELRELIEDLGWSCSVEGERWKLETNGVYFIR